MYLLQRRRKGEAEKVTEIAGTKKRVNNHIHKLNFGLTENIDSAVVGWFVVELQCAECTTHHVIDTCIAFAPSRSLISLNLVAFAMLSVLMSWFGHKNEIEENAYESDSYSKSDNEKNKH